MKDSNDTSRKYELSSMQIRDVVEGYAWLTALYTRLQQESSPAGKAQIARTVINEALPFYRRVLPEGLDHLSARFVSPSLLEETCKKILAAQSI